MTDPVTRLHPSDVNHLAESTTDMERRILVPDEVLWERASETTPTVDVEPSEVAGVR